MTEKNIVNRKNKLPKWTNTSEPDMPEDKEAKRKRRVDDKSARYIDKYRPDCLEEVRGQEHLQKSFRDTVEKGKIYGKFDNMIFTGPKGVGKISVAQVLAREILGPQWKDNFLEVNVPNENNNLEFLNNQLKNFIKNGPLNGALFKIVFLDECEYLTKEAQSALKKIFDDPKYKHARYILATNYSERLLDALLDGRIQVYHFKKISNEIMKDYLNLRCTEEGIKSEDGATLDLILDLIVEYADGSLRNGLSLLDNLTDVNKKISLQNVKNRLAFIEPKNVEKLVEKAIYAQDYLRYYNEEILKQNLSIPKLLDEITTAIDKLKFKDQKEKRYVINQLGLYSFRINQGTDQTLQLKCFLNSLASIHDN